MSLDKRSEPYKTKNLRWIRLKIFLLSRLDRFPLIKGPVLRIWRIIKWYFFKCKWKLRAMVNISDRKFDIDKIHWVDPKTIKYCSLKEFDIYKYKGKIIRGNWDELVKKFEELDTYIALKEVCTEEKNWGNTIFYQRLINRLEKGEILWGCKNKTELYKRCKNLEFLYQKIKNEGYKSQYELSIASDEFMPLKIEDEITASIGRYGDLLFSSSGHRLAIAKLLGIEKIPIKIAVRHPQWIKFKKELLSYVKDHCGKTYQALTHPDLNDISAFHKSEDRYQLIFKNISAKGGRLLDIGANWGYFCIKFEDKGFNCYAVENSLQNLYFLRKIKRAENKKFKIISTSIFNYQEIETLQFDVVLALNIFHHFLKKKKDYLKFCNFLNSLKVKEMFFEPHLLDEPQMKDSYKNYYNEGFVEFILQNSKLKNAKLIGEAEDRRKIYKLY